MPGQHSITRPLSQQGAAWSLSILEQHIKCIFTRWRSRALLCRIINNGVSDSASSLTLCIARHLITHTRHTMYFLTYAVIHLGPKTLSTSDVPPLWCVINERTFYGESIGLVETASSGSCSTTLMMFLVFGFNQECVSLHRTQLLFCGIGLIIVAWLELFAPANAFVWSRIVFFLLYYLFSWFTIRSG